jgi:hypothetical protein
LSRGFTVKSKGIDKNKILKTNCVLAMKIGRIGITEILAGVG